MAAAPSNFLSMLLSFFVFTDPTSLPESASRLFLRSIQYYGMNSARFECDRRVPQSLMRQGAFSLHLGKSRLLFALQRHSNAVRAICFTGAAGATHRERDRGADDSRRR